MKTNPIKLLVALVLVMAAVPSQAEVGPPRLRAGLVSDLRGTATATAPDGSVRDLAAGGVVYNGDTLQTGAGSLLRLAMTDQSMYTVKADTRIQIKDYRYQPAAPASDSEHLYLFRGAFRFLTGLIGKRNPDKVAYETPVATIGIRGTEGEIRFSGGGESVFRVCVLTDSIVLKLKENLVWTVPAGQAVTLTLDRKTGMVHVQVNCHCEPEIPGVIPGMQGILERNLYRSGSSGGGGPASPN
jgi:hypothetical protein